MNSQSKVLKAIRNKCMDCFEDPDNCPNETCPLFVFRKGINPFKRKRKMSINSLNNLKNRKVLSQ